MRAVIPAPSLGARLEPRRPRPAPGLGARLEPRRPRPARARRPPAAKAGEPRYDEGREGSWKWAVRRGVWDEMEARGFAEAPRPVHHRIPNFKGADAAARRLSELPEFASAATVKVNPDTPQRGVRLAVLEQGKTLLTPQPRLRTGFFSSLTADAVLAQAGAGDRAAQLLGACSSKGAAKYGRPVALGDSLRVDLVVVGSVAVAPSGCRIGKGEGFAELELGVLGTMGAVDASTPVVTAVHDCQVLSDAEIPAGAMLPWDTPVDVIVTPTRVIRTGARRVDPRILWERLSPQKLAGIRVLQQLRREIEERTGEALPVGPDEVLPPVAERRGRGGRGSGGG